MSHNRRSDNFANGETLPVPSNGAVSAFRESRSLATHEGRHVTPDFHIVNALSGGRKCDVVLSRRTLVRFFSRVTVTPSGCWAWTGGALNGKGYAAFGTTLAHRIAHRWFVGPIPPGFQIDHLCRNRVCVNPAHLEAVTVKENLRRSHAWTRTGHCRRGHAITPENVITNHRNGITHRDCRTCRMASRRRWSLRRRAA